MLCRENIAFTDSYDNSDFILICPLAFSVYISQIFYTGKGMHKNERKEKQIQQNNKFAKQL